LKNFKKEAFIEFLRFSLLGGIGVSVGYLILYALTELNVWYLLSSVIAYILNILISFEIHKFWTFKKGEAKITVKQILLYFTVTIIFFGTNTGLLYVLVEYCHIYYLIAQIILTVLLGVPNWYFSAKVFKL
jgi:putative flippase GtrA